MKKVKKLKRLIELRSAIIYVIVFAIVGVAVLTISKATSPSALIDPKSADLNGNVSFSSDSSSSGGGFITFGGEKLNTVTPPPEIVSDCSVDVAPDLNIWLASLPKNTIVVLKKDACYLTEDQIDILDKSHFKIQGNNATFRRTVRQGNTGIGNHMHIRIARSDFIDVSDLNITGPKLDSEGYNSGLEGQHAFGIYGVVHGTFDNLKIGNVWGDCFYLNSGNMYGITNHLSQYITIQNSVCHQTGRHGVGFLATSDVLITRNTIENNHRENFDFEPYGTGRGGANNVTIDDNDIGEASQLLVSEGGGSAEFKNFVFSNNRVHRRFSMVFEGYTGSRIGPLKIVNNTSDKPNSGGALQINGFNDVTVEGNHITIESRGITGQPNAFFMQLYHSSNIKINNNIAEGAKDTLNFDAHSDTYCGSGNTPNFINLPPCN